METTGWAIADIRLLWVISPLITATLWVFLIQEINIDDFW
jgi:hypothetical protein